MRAKPVIRVILFLGAILTVVSAYLFLYFYPAVKTMNRIKRETTDFQMKIGEMRKRLSFIRLPDEKEKESVAFQDRRLLSELKRTDPVPAPDSRRDKTEDYLRGLALQTGIGRLDIARRTPSDRLAGINIRSFDIPGLSARSVSVVFSAPLKQAFVYLTSIPAGSVSLSVDQVEIREASPNPDFLVIIKAAFRGFSETHRGETEADIDIDSTLLLGRVTEIPADGIDAPDQSGEWNRFLFARKLPLPAIEKK